MLGPRKSVARSDKRIARTDAARAVRDARELRRQISRDLFKPARVTSTHISQNLRQIDKQLSALDRVGEAIRDNRTQYSTLRAEKARLKEQKRAMKMAKKARKLGASPKEVSRSARIFGFLARRKS
jgi:hypothetical protein